MKNSNKNILIFVFLVGSFLILKSLFSLTGNTQQPVDSFAKDLHEVEYETQFKVDKKSEDNVNTKRAKVLKAQAKFNFNPSTSSRRENIAQAPTNDNQITADTTSTNEQPSEDASNKKSSVAKQNKTKDETDTETDEEKNDEDTDENKVAEETEDNQNDIDDLDQPAEEYESKDLALLNNTRTEDVVSFRTTTVPQPVNNNDDSDDDTNTNSGNGSGYSDVKSFTFDPATSTVLETLLTNGDYSAIDSILNDGSADKKTAYYQIVKFYSQNPDARDNVTSLLNTYYFNIDSVNILAGHLTDEETNLSEKQISYVYLTQLINSWPSDNDAQQFNVIFVEGVNQRLSGPLDGELTPNQELYLQLSETILIKLDEIDSLQA